MAIIVTNVCYLLLILLEYSSSILSDNNLHAPAMIGLGLNSFATSVSMFYVAEISTATFRAFFLGFNLTTSYAVEIVKPKTADAQQIQQLLIICAILSFLSSLVSIIVPETPYYLALRGNLREAKAVFTWIRVGRLTDEYESMINKVQDTMEKEGIIKKISSSAFVVCMILSMSLKIFNYNGCALQQQLLVQLYLNKKQYAYLIEEYKPLLDNQIFAYHTFIGCCIFSFISLVIPRKMIYGIGFLLTILHAVPVILIPSASYTITTLFPICTLIVFSTREQLAFILPFEVSTRVPIMLCVYKFIIMV